MLGMLQRHTHTHRPTSKILAAQLGHQLLQAIITHSLQLMMLLMKRISKGSGCIVSRQHGSMVAWVGSVGLVWHTMRSCVRTASKTASSTATELGDRNMRSHTMSALIICAYLQSTSSHDEASSPGRMHHLALTTVLRRP